MILRLRDKITIQKGVDVKTEYNSTEQQFVDYLTTSANVYVRSGSITNDDKYGETILYTTEFTIRYTSLSKEIDNTYRINFNDRYYSIIEVIEIESKHAIKLVGKHYGQ